MAVDVDKLIADAKAKQEAARTDAAKAQAQASKDKIDAETRARSKSQTDYANTLKPRLEQYESQLAIWARKIARGDKLSAIEQKEFDKLVKDYNSLNKTVDAAIKKSNDILVEARKKAAASSPTPTPDRGGAPTGPTGPTSPTPAPTPTPTPTPTPKPKPGTPKPKPGEPTPTPAEKKTLTIDEIIDQVAKNYGSIDTIFKTNPDLQALLRKAIGKDGVPNTDDDLTPDQFVKELENTTWFKQNANAVRQRGFYKRQFDDLIKTGSNADELLKTTEYGRGLTYTKQVIADEAKRLGVTVSPDELDLISRDIYDLGYENQPAIVAQRIRAKISYKPGTQLSGVAGENIAELRKVAASNGLDLDKNFGSSLQGWLQNLAQGESIETYKQIIRSAAKLGLPDKVSSLIDQGVDLDTIYNPYRNIMASVLEINPETINLNDKVLRSAIGPDKEMSLYDFQKMLRKDDRWQYTSNAKEEVSGIALGILRDFGFQG
jgi:hypothetical protein